ncbi:hypothetical protein D1610_04805 [Sphingomonas gilva]|uniref:Uncharacterized protein n=1 Tax=Sphingomonas gilva TaxID=2305907 RepID=A0A396RN23_9SPHN|nr:hypothetical protein [Sphingomonas gilva]RHW17844.1 hypothetical protein D1610_04805 [Sphingomonas gilva]
MFPSDSPDDLLLFTPVPLGRATAADWHPHVQREFIRALVRLGVVAAAARSVGRSARSAYRLRARPGAESFAAAWDEAQAIAASRAWDTVVARGFGPIERPVFHRGRQVGVRQHYDNRLLTSALFAQDRAADRLAAAHGHAAPEEIFAEAMALIGSGDATKFPTRATQCPNTRDSCDARSGPDGSEARPAR